MVDKERAGWPTSWSGQTLACLTSLLPHTRDRDGGPYQQLSLFSPPNDHSGHGTNVMYVSPDWRVSMFRPDMTSVVDWALKAIIYRFVLCFDSVWITLISPSRLTMR